MEGGVEAPIIDFLDPLAQWIHCLQSPGWPIFLCGKLGALCSYSETTRVLEAGVAEVT